MYSGTTGRIFSSQAIVGTPTDGSPGKPIPALVLILLASDLFFIDLNIVWALLELAGLAPDRWYVVKIRSDYGLPEITNMMKYLMVIGFLMWDVATQRRRIWWPMAAAFGLLFLDDAFRVHENVSAWIGHTFLQDVAGPGQPASTLGQLPYYVVIGAAIFGLAFLSRQRARTGERRMANLFIALLVLLAFFAAGVDFVNSFILEGLGPWWLGAIGSLVENGSELIVTTLCVWVALETRRLGTAGSDTSRSASA